MYNIESLIQRGEASAELNVYNGALGVTIKSVNPTKPDSNPAVLDASLLRDVKATLSNNDFPSVGMCNIAVEDGVLVITAPDNMPLVHGRNLIVISGVYINTMFVWTVTVTGVDTGAESDTIDIQISADGSVKGVNISGTRMTLNDTLTIDSSNKSLSHGGYNRPAEMDIVTLTDEQKTEVEQTLGYPYSYCDTYYDVELNSSIYKDSECTQLVGVAAQPYSGSITGLSGMFFDIRNEIEPVVSGTYYCRRETIARGDYSHAEGDQTTAIGIGSHAEGFRTIAEGLDSHAEGGTTKALGPYSHAEGSETMVYDSASTAHAEGQGTIASSFAQHVEGKYNVEDPNETYALIVGNGSSDNDRHNAFAIGWNGSLYLFLQDGTPVELTPEKLDELVA